MDQELVEKILGPWKIGCREKLKIVIVICDKNFCRFIINMLGKF